MGDNGDNGGGGFQLPPPGPSDGGEKPAEPYKRGRSRRPPPPDVDPRAIYDRAKAGGEISIQDRRICAEWCSRELGMTQDQIAQVFKVSQVTIGKDIRRFDAPKMAKLKRMCRRKHHLIRIFEWAESVERMNRVRVGRMLARPDPSVEEVSNAGASMAGIASELTSAAAKAAKDGQPPDEVLSGIRVKVESLSKALMGAAGKLRTQASAVLMTPEFRESLMDPGRAWKIFADEARELGMIDELYDEDEKPLSLEQLRIIAIAKGVDPTSFIRTYQQVKALNEQTTITVQAITASSGPGSDLKKPD